MSIYKVFVFGALHIEIVLIVELTVLSFKSTTGIRFLVQYLYVPSL